MTSLSTLKKEFHRLSYPERFAVLQQTVCSYYGCHLSKPLYAAQVVREEVVALQKLLTHQYIGAFASMFYAGHSGWRQWVYGDITPEVEKAFEMASKANLWLKYVGLEIETHHGLGEIVHALSITAEGYLRSSPEGHSMMSPGTVAASYERGLDGLCTTSKRALFVGAFSPISVMDIWAIHRHFLDNQGYSIGIIDVEGYLSELTANYYNLEFRNQDGRKTTLAEGSVGVVLSNYLTPALARRDEVEAIKRRKEYFREAYRILDHNGRLVIVEPPMHVDDSGQLSLDFCQLLDQHAIHSSLLEIGFKVDILEPARHFPTRFAADRFVKTGRIYPKQLEVKYGHDLSYLIVATKA